jgi:hypothetical protein
VAVNGRLAVDPCGGLAGDARDGKLLVTVSGFADTPCPTSAGYSSRDEVDICGTDEDVPLPHVRAGDRLPARPPGKRLSAEEGEVGVGATIAVGFGADARPLAPAVCTIDLGPDASQASPSRP